MKFKTTLTTIAILATTLAGTAYATDPYLNDGSPQFYNGSNGSGNNSDSGPLYDKEPFMQIGLGMVKKDVQTFLKDLGLASSSSCPKAGIEVVEKISSKVGKVLKAPNYIDDVIDSVKPNVEDKRNDNSKCGSCQQVNVVSYLAAISPQRIATNSMCDNMPAETFVADLDDKHDISKFTEAILTGANNEGKKLANACPDPCSYYITTAQTTYNNGKTHLTLTVQCGQPRKDSIFSANYDYNGGLIHQWTCQK